MNYYFDSFDTQIQCEEVYGDPNEVTYVTSFSPMPIPVLSPEEEALLPF